MYRVKRVNHTADIGPIQLPGSKSEMNRALILQAIHPEIQIQGGSDADDVTRMRQALQSDSMRKDLGNAGTCMRFLTALYAATPGVHVQLDCSEAMKQRPIGELSQVLQLLGADIRFLEKPGFPPVEIIGKRLSGNTITIDASQSSQFISACMLAAPLMDLPMQIQVKGNIASRAYIESTATMLRSIGYPVQMDDQTMCIGQRAANSHSIIQIEADWSSAGYWYMILALLPSGTVCLPNLQIHSQQADKRNAWVFSDLGITGSVGNNELILSKTSAPKCSSMDISLRDTPDMAMSLAATLAALGIPAQIRDVDHLAIKECNRLVLFPQELAANGFGIRQVSGQWIIDGTRPDSSQILRFHTYEDHRLAMSMAALAAAGYTVEVDHADCVQKSYPGFWQDLMAAGFSIESFE